jgi:chemotaxis protein histidine kinase CheA
MLNVKEAIENRTGEESKILHTLKGLMGHIGSTYMQQAFEDIEDFVNNRKRGYKKKLDDLSLELDEMFQDIFMALINYKQTQDNKEVDHDEVIRLLEQIETPLLNGNINEIKVITEQLRRFVIHPSIDETYDVLSNQIKRYQYDDAINSLQKIYSSWEASHGKDDFDY